MKFSLSDEELKTALDKGTFSSDIEYNLSRAVLLGHRSSRELKTRLSEELNTHLLSYIKLGLDNIEDGITDEVGDRLRRVSVFTFYEDVGPTIFLTFLQQFLQSYPDRKDNLFSSVIENFDTFCVVSLDNVEKLLAIYPEQQEKIYRMVVKNFHYYCSSGTAPQFKFTSFVNSNFKSCWGDIDQVKKLLALFPGHDDEIFALVVNNIDYYTLHNIYFAKALCCLFPQHTQLIFSAIIKNFDNYGVGFSNMSLLTNLYFKKYPLFSTENNVMQFFMFASNIYQKGGQSKTTDFNNVDQLTIFFSEYKEDIFLEVLIKFDNYDQLATLLPHHREVIFQVLHKNYDKCFSNYNVGDIKDLVTFFPERNKTIYSLVQNELDRFVANKGRNVEQLVQLFPLYEQEIRANAKIEIHIENFSHLTRNQSAFSSPVFSNSNNNNNNSNNIISLNNTNQNNQPSPHIHNNVKPRNTLVSKNIVEPNVFCRMFNRFYQKQYRPSGFRAQQLNEFKTIYQALALAMNSENSLVSALSTVEKSFSPKPKLLFSDIYYSIRDEISAYQNEQVLRNDFNEFMHWIGDKKTLSDKRFKKIYDVIVSEKKSGINITPPIFRI